MKSYLRSFLRHKFIENLSRFMIAGAIVSAALYFIVYREPVVYHGVTVLTPEVTAGERVKLAYHRTKNRQCITEITQFVVHEATGEAYLRLKIPGGYGALGEKIVPVSVPTQPDWPPGGYIYQPTVLYDCGLFEVTGMIPVARFNIHPPK